MPRSRAVDDFHLAYDRTGSGRPVLLLHGWPGDRTDFDGVVARMAPDVDVVVPDLRGFGESDKHPVEPSSGYSAEAQARSVLGLVDELALGPLVVAGYDVGSRVAQTLARLRPEQIRALVVTPPLPGVGTRVLDPEPQREFWYQAFHQLELAGQLLDGRPDAVRAYLQHFWSHWSGPQHHPDGARLDRLTSHYASAGAFVASIAWYRAGAGTVARSVSEQPPDAADRIAVPTTVLWPEHDPLFPAAWSDRLGEFFTDIRIEHLAGAGHFVPVEAPEAFAAAVLAAVQASETGAAAG